MSKNKRSAQSLNERGTFSEICEKVQVEQNVIVRTFRDEAIPVESGELGLQVNSRLLHQALKSSRQYANWIADRISRYRLKEGRDFLTKLLKSSGGRRATDYVVSVNAAKELAMLEFNETGTASMTSFFPENNRLKKLMLKILIVSTKIKHFFDN